MYLQLLFLLQFLCLNTLSSDDYQCGSNFPLVTDLSQEDCDLEGKYYEEEHEGCFPGCYSARKRIFCDFRSQLDEKKKSYKRGIRTHDLLFVKQTLYH